MSEETPKTSLYEIIIAILLGLGAIGGGWASYQASQWGSTAVQSFGKSSKTATEGATEYNLAVAISTRDADLDVKGKELVVSAMTEKDDVVKARDLAVAKYLYTQQMTADGYAALGYPAEFRPKDKAGDLPDETLEKGLDAELGEDYMEKVVAPAEEKFTEADKIFAEGDKVSNRSTEFGQAQMIFTIALFLGGLGLVIKSNLKWVFLASGYGTILWASVELLRLPWYHG